MFSYRIHALLLTASTEAVTGTGAGSVSFTAAATAKHGVAGTAAGSRTVTGSASGTHGVTGTASASRTVTASATGAHGVSGAGSYQWGIFDPVIFDPAVFAVRVPFITGSATGTFGAVTGTAAGSLTASASGAGAHGVAGAGAGSLAVSGTADGAHDDTIEAVTGEGAGSVTVQGACTAAHGVSGAGGASCAPAGSASAGHGVSGTGASLRGLFDAAVFDPATFDVGLNGFSITGQASGTFGAVTGSGSGQVAASGAAAGAHGVSGTGAATLGAIAGTGTGEHATPDVTGSGSGQVIITASGTGTAPEQGEVEPAAGAGGGGFIKARRAARITPDPRGRPLPKDIDGPETMPARHVEEPGDPTAELVDIKVNLAADDRPRTAASALRARETAQFSARLAQKQHSSPDGDQGGEVDREIQIRAPAPQPAGVAEDQQAEQHAQDAAHQRQGIAHGVLPALTGSGAGLFIDRVRNDNDFILMAA